MRMVTDKESAVIRHAILSICNLQLEKLEEVHKKDALFSLHIVEQAIRRRGGNQYGHLSLEELAVLVQGIQEGKISLSAIRDPRRGSKRVAFSGKRCSRPKCRKFLPEKEKVCPDCEARTVPDKLFDLD